MNKFLISILIFITIISCQTNPYLELEKKELSSGVRYDSLFLGVKFGMTSKEFYAHCWDLNRKKLITQGPSNNSVRYYLPTESIGQKIEMLFYPVFDNDIVYEVNTTFSYTGWAPWNKETSSDYLIDEVREILSEWYNSKFYEIKNPKNNSTLYTTVSGNRRIVITKVSEREVRARYTDLTIEKKIKK
ncbi:MAG: hypothetical protein CMB86_05685 [Flammeovirgaceae bacterium]|nr:hypothetical protein [Flammeovirgaceae bacterium]